MFKNSKNNKPARKPGGGAAMMQQMGFQMPNVGGIGMNDDDDDDDDLEAELQRLQGYGGGAGSGGKKGKSGAAMPDLRGFHNDVNKLLHDIDQPINDDDLSDVDENDLLAELNEITNEIETDNQQIDKNMPQARSNADVTSLLEGRQDMYVKAIAAAKASGDAAKSRRLERQLKTIQELLQSARSGVPIDESSIPPEVFVASKSSSTAPQPQQVPVRAPSPPRPEPPPAAHPRAVRLPQPPPTVTPAAVPTPKNDNPVVFRSQPQPPPAPVKTVAEDPAITRLKALALQAKRQGDITKAKEYIIQLKTLQSKTSTASASVPVQKETYDNVDDDEPPPALPLKAPEPHTIMEALQQRYDELTKRGEEAARHGDKSKARRMERLSKQYDEAMDATRKGRPYDYNELPDIPGFAPIPIQQLKASSTAQSSSTITAGKSTASNVQGKLPQSEQQQQQQRAVALAATASSTSARKSQQAQTLRLKQEKFYKLAGQAKQRGDNDTAKKFLIAYKGLEQMIAAAEAGFPVDMSQVPRLPDDDNDLINDDDLTQDLANADRDTIYRRLQDDLLRQIQLCARNQQILERMEEGSHNRQADEFKSLEQRCSRDLEKLRKSFQHGLKPPLFHYERKQMNIIQVNDDLGDNDLEVSIIRGINLPVPSGISSSSLETYVAIEFPYPTDEPQTARTRHGVGSANAEYPESLHKFYIKRNDAKFKRLMNRKELKLVVFYKPGFLRSDRPLGIASIKLATLEQTCTIHESADLYEAEHKKKIEGKLEVKLRIREALGQTKASDILPQRWLIIDRFEETIDNKKSSHSSSSSKAPAITAIARLVPSGTALGELAMNLAGNQTNIEEKDSSQMTDHQRRRSSQPQQQQQQQKTTPVPVSTGPLSVQILNYEASLLQQQIEQLQDRLTSEQLHQLKMKRRSIEEQSDRLVESLRKGGRQAVQEHIHGLHELIDYYDQEAREYHQRRDTKKADLALTKKKLAMKEIDTLSGSAPTTSTKF